MIVVVYIKFYYILILIIFVEIEEYISNKKKLYYYNQKTFLTIKNLDSQYINDIYILSQLWGIIIFKDF